MPWLRIADVHAVAAKRTAWRQERIDHLEHAHDVDLGPVFTVMSWTVLLSIVAHGLTATPGAAAYGRWWTTKGPEAHDMVEAEPMHDGSDGD